MILMTPEAMLEFENRWTVMGGGKEAAIRETFEVPPARYYQRLNALLKSGDAVKLDPITVRRLLRARNRRLSARSKKKFELI